MHFIYDLCSQSQAGDKGAEGNADEDSLEFDDSERLFTQSLGSDEGKMVKEVSNKIGVANKKK